jgi:cytochrome P450
MRFTVDAISGLAFGADINTLESDADVIQRHLDRIFPTIFRRLLSPVPTWRWWRTRADREVDASVAAVNVAIRDFIAAARARLAADPARREKPANLLEAMLVAADTEGSGIGEQEIAGNVMTMLLAGEDTTAHTLAWAIDFLHRHPEAATRARAEVDALCGPIGNWTIERFAALPWLEACASETMRLKPVAPALTLQVLRDTVVSGVLLPKGTIVWGALRTPSLERRHFADPERFDPGRWLEGRWRRRAPFRPTAWRCRSAPAPGSAPAVSWRCSR